MKTLLSTGFFVLCFLLPTRALWTASNPEILFNLYDEQAHPIVVAEAILRGAYQMRKDDKYYEALFSFMDRKMPEAQATEPSSHPGKLAAGAKRVGAAASWAALKGLAYSVLLHAELRAGLNKVAPLAWKWPVAKLKGKSPVDAFAARKDVPADENTRVMEAFIRLAEGLGNAIEGKIVSAFNAIDEGILLAELRDSSTRKRAMENAAALSEYIKTSEEPVLAKKIRDILNKMPPEYFFDDQGKTNAVSELRASVSRLKPVREACQLLYSAANYGKGKEFIDRMRARAEKFSDWVFTKFARPPQNKTTK